MSQGKLSTPAAIVVAGALIGLGLFLGLRGRAPSPEPPPARTEAPPAPSAAASTGEAPAAAPPVRSAAPAMPAPAATASHDVVAQQIAAVLAKQHAALVDRCWKPNAGASPPPKPARFVFSFTIGADGGQLGRGVREERGTGSVEITRCVLSALTPVTVPPPGASVAVDVPFGVP